MVPSLPMHLHPHVVAAAVVAGGDSRDEGAVVEGEDGGGGVDVAGLAEERLALVGAGRVDATDLAAGDEADDVEVVDRAVAEDAAARRDVGGVRRRLVVGGRPDGVDEARARRRGPPAAAAGSRGRSGAGSRCGPGRRCCPRAWRARWSRPGSRRPASRRRSGRRPRRPGAAAARGPGSQSAMTKPSRPESSRLAGSGANPSPSRVATSRAASASASVTTSSSTTSRPFRVSAWKAPIRPTPASPIRMCRSDHVVVSAVSTPWSRVAGADLAWSSANSAWPATRGSCQPFVLTFSRAIQGRSNRYSAGMVKQLDHPHRPRTPPSRCTTSSPSSSSARDHRRAAPAGRPVRERDRARGAPRPLTPHGPPRHPGDGRPGPAAAPAGPRHHGGQPQVHRRAELTSLFDDLKREGSASPSTTVLSHEIVKDERAATALGLPRRHPPALDRAAAPRGGRSRSR